MILTSNLLEIPFLLPSPLSPEGCGTKEIDFLDAHILQGTYVFKVHQSLSGPRVVPGPPMFSREFKDWHFQWGNGFKRLFGNSWSDNDDFLANPHEISILMKW